VETLNKLDQIVADNGALQNTVGDNIWDGPVVILPQTQPSINGSFPSFSAASGTSLTLPSSITGQYLMVGGGGIGYNGNNGGGTIILPSGTDFTEQTVITGGTVQDDGTLGNIGLNGGVIGGSGTVAKISDWLTTQTPQGINPGDNGDSVLSSGAMSYPNELTDELMNTGPVALTATGVVLGSNDTYYAYIPAPASSNTLLQVDGKISLGNSILAGTVNPDVLPSFSPAATIIETNYDGGANPSDLITGYFLDQTPTGAPPTPLDTQLTSVPGLGTTAFVVHTTSAYIGNERFDVDYIGATPNGTVYEVVVRRVTEHVTVGTLIPSVPPGAPITQLSSNSWQVEYGEDAQFSVYLVPEANPVILTGSTVLFQVIDAFGKTYQFNVPVVPVSPLTEISGVTEYVATLDLPQSLTVPLTTTTTLSPPSSYTISALYDGQLSDGAQLFSPQADGVVTGEPGNTVQVGPADELTVAPTPTTTTLIQVPAGTTQVYGTPLTFTATVTSTLPAADEPTGLSQPVAPPEGTVSFYDLPPGASTPILLGTSTVNTSAGVTTANFQDAMLPVGNHFVYAVYNADGVPDNYSPTSTSATLPEDLITQATDTLTLGANPTTIGYNGQITFTATVTPPAGNQGLPTGDVTFTLANGTVLGVEQLFTVGGVTSATLVTPPFGIPGGVQTVYAYYPGDGNFEQSTPFPASIGVTVNPINTIVETPTSSINPATAGQSVTFTVKIDSVLTTQLTAAITDTNPTDTITVANAANISANDIIDR
jgi:hypothetical protein